MKRRIPIQAFTLAFTTSAFLGLPGQSAHAEEWRQYAKPEQAGWSSAELEEARRFAKDIGSGAVMIVDHGHVVAAWGTVSHPFKMASIRKSIYDATVGATHLIHPFDVNTTLAQLKIDDIETLTATEKQATFEDLLTARSGVYHAAAYETRSNARRRPKRGSAQPGANWYYNNWDFNVVCVAFELIEGQSMARAFAERIAKPLGMEDFKPEHVFEWLEPRISRYPAVTIRLSARDLARVGQLYLQKGRWGDSEIVASDWVERSTKAHTVFEPGHYRGEGNGYGRLWWIFPARPERNSPYEAYRRIAARGTGGQIMVLFPDIDVLVVHLSDTDSGRGVSDRQGVALMDQILGARREAPRADAQLTSLHVEPLGNAPRALHTDYAKVPKSLRDAVEGRYESGEGGGMRLYQYDNRLFVQPLGVPLNDAELLLVSDGTLRSPLAPVVMEPIEGEDGSITSMRITVRGRTQVGERVK